MSSQAPLCGIAGPVPPSRASVAPGRVELTLWRVITNVLGGSSGVAGGIALIAIALRRALGVLGGCVAALTVAVSSWSEAAEITSSPLKEGTDVALIVISGEISDGDSEKFRQVALTSKRAVVFLDSNGGSTIEALEIGKLIKIAGFSTYVSSYAPCNSACSLVWVAGSKRFLGEGGKVGFHATYIENNGKRMESGVGNAIVGSYLDQLHLSERAIIFATSAAPDEIKYLTLTNSADSEISTEKVGDANSTHPADTESDRTVTSSSEKTNDRVTKFGSVGSWGIYFDPSMSGCFMISSYEDGLVLRIGYDARSSPSAYILVIREEWKSIISGKIYDAAFRIGNNSPWTGNFLGVDMSGSRGLAVVVSMEKLLAELSNSSSFQLYYKGKSISSGELGDVAGAVRALQGCQSRHRIATDPFAE